MGARLIDSKNRRWIVGLEKKSGYNERRAPMSTYLLVTHEEFVPAANLVRF